MATTTLPVEMVLVAYSGTTMYREFRWLPDGTNPQDFTGWSALMLIGTQRHSATVALTLTNGGIRLSTVGVITIEVTPDQTSLLEGVPNLRYSLDLIDTLGRSTRFLHGQLNLVVDVDPLP